MRFSLVPIRNFHGEPHPACADVMFPLLFAIRRLGHIAEISDLADTVSCDRAILVGALADLPVSGVGIQPGKTIFANLEGAFGDAGNGKGEGFLEHLKKLVVWDIDPRNVAFLAARGIEAARLPLGYVPEMNRLVPGFSTNKEVFVFGAADAEPPTVLDCVRRDDISLVRFPADTVGRERDIAIAGCRLCYYEPRAFATCQGMARLAYLLANRKVVVVERGGEMPAGFADACVQCEPGEAGGVIEELLDNEAMLCERAEAGFAVFSRMRLEQPLAELIGRGEGYDPELTGIASRPDYLHIGSGRDFRNNALNIDINPQCHPDLVLDLSKPLEHGIRYRTERFGEIALTAGTFDKITAFEVLEHVADLPQTMRNFLDLLREGGQLTVSVPYDLSYGAWQDPTHVRAFNERSWQYFTNNAWYLGWREECFELERIIFTLAGGGAREGMRWAKHSRFTKVPRNVEGMRVTLRKRRTTDEERRLHDRMYRNMYRHPVIHWETENKHAAYEEEEFILLAADFTRWCFVRVQLFCTTCCYVFCKLLRIVGIGKNMTIRLKQRRNRLRRVLGLG